MKYRSSPTKMEIPVNNEPPATGATNLSELCIGILDEILLRLETEEVEGNDDLVHQVRVMTKRLRAAWKLVKGMMPEERIRERRAALRDISADFSGSRDEAVLKGLCGELSEGKGDREERALRSLRESLPSPETTGPDSPEPLARQLEQEKEAWHALDWNVPAAPLEIVTRNLEASFEKARQSTWSAQQTLCSENWHEWRKVIKQLRYQREFLAEMEGRPLSEFENRITDLGSLLGERNDLANLEKLAASGESLSPSDRETVASVIGQATAGILEECRRLGEELFPRETSVE